MPLATDVMPIDKLVPYPGNPRHGDVETIAESLTELGQYRHVVVNVGDHPDWSGEPYTILAGNHTVLAAESLGWDTIEVNLVDVDDVHAAKINAVDNRANDKAGYDDQALADMLANLPDLYGTGYTDIDLNDLLRSLEPPSLADLTEQFGEPQDSDTWPRFTVQLPPATLAKLNKALALWDAPLETQILRLANHALRTKNKAKK